MDDSQQITSAEDDRRVEDFAARYPQDGCQTYNKEWIVTVGGGHLSDAPVRWVLGMIITALSIRDEERSIDGLVKATNTQIWTWGLIIGGSILVILLIAAFVYIFMTWEFGGQTGHERVTMFCLRLEDRIFPVTMSLPLFSCRGRLPDRRSLH